ncbi:MAG: NAD-dependent epimerase/dehydratase family protein [Candidatus Hatepunaea meridiana]|nr:NAD-dependent epimerase/dehydratase family protein [Candidatus Hatepunaea meridiana]
MNDDSEISQSQPDISEKDIRGERKILLTGSTGFVGTHTAQHLVERGYNLRCLVRNTSDTSRLPRNVELATGSLSNYESLKRAVKGCWGVMHVGGIVRAQQVRDFYLVNRDGTSNLITAACEAGVERFMLCSSIAAVGPSTPARQRQTDERPNPITDYGRSKLAGEEVLQKGAGEMWWCVVRPPPVYGPWDVAFYTLVKWVNRGFKIRLGEGKMPLSIIHGADLARAMTLAIEADHPSGAKWFATDGADHDLPELLGAIESALDKNARWITIPEWIAPGVARIIEFTAKLRGDTALLSRQKLDEMLQPAWTCDDEPLRKATGYREMFNLEDGMRQTVEWYFEQRWI